MKILEPTTTITDYILAAETVVLGVLMLRNSAKTNVPARLWAHAFFTSAMAAAAGGTYHGFGESLGALAPVLWKITVITIGCTSMLLLCAIALAFFADPVRKWLPAIAILQFLVYAFWMAGHNEFKYVVYDYAPSMLLILILQLFAMQRSVPGSGWIAAGILVSFAAAGIQRSSLNLHPEFNHNDLYHVVQMIAMILLYRGGRQLQAPQTLQTQARP